MSPDIGAFYEDFFQDIHSTAEADQQLAEDTFFDLFCRHLVESGEIDTADRAQYIGARGLRVDGYGGDPIETNGPFTLIIADFKQSNTISTLTATEMTAIFKRLENFLTKSTDRTFRNSLEETSPGFGLADLLNQRIRGVPKIRLLLITNRLLSSRVDSRRGGIFQGVPVTYGVWDIGRLHRYATSGRGREDLEIDLVGDFGGPLLLLPAHLDGAGYQAYLAAVPGSQLASIYDRWGARLLEQNVRCFLQARGNVNKGIRNTIHRNPEMFFAYNNGITATAESIRTEQTDRGLLLTHVTNLQIVNGGQTTASIHAAKRNKDVDLSKVFVQMKMSIVDPERSEVIVPKISEFANSQNRVNAADFFANHPFHIRMEEFSRRIFAPAPDGTFVQSKWFYERARGQYLDARAHLTKAQRKRFDLEYPRNQMFSKTDLAKFVNVWHGHPEIVSKGAQKNFAEFAKRIGREFATAPDAFNETYYRHSIAKAIVFRHVEKLVTRQDWYEGGYRANVVAYTIAKLAHDLGARGQAVDFDSIWKRQAVSPTLTDCLCTIARAVHDVIVDPPEGMRNVTEWAKKQGCWQRVQDLAPNLPMGVDAGLVTMEQRKSAEQAAVKEQKVLNEAKALMAVFEAGSDLWRSVKDWGERHRLLSLKEAGILESAYSMPDRLPSEKQSLVILETLRKLQAEGCPLGDGIA